MKAIIIGAGIGGLTAALALRSRGIDVAVYERAAELRDVGAGISLWLNAIRGLRQLGLGEAILKRSTPYARTAILRADGRVIVESSLDDFVHPGSCADGAAMVVFHRADLLRTLADPVRDAIHLDRTCTGFAVRSDRVVARFHDGSEAEADVLIGADGIRSAIRAQLHPGEKTRYLGYTAWRCVARVKVATPQVSETWGCGQRFGIVPMQGDSVYWFSTQNTPEGQTDPPGNRANPCCGCSETGMLRFQS